MLEPNIELVEDLRQLLTAAEQGIVQNILYFAEIGDNLLVGQQGSFDVDRYEDIIMVVEQVQEHEAEFDESSSAKRLIRI